MLETSLINQIIEKIGDNNKNFLKDSYAQKQSEWNEWYIGNVQDFHTYNLNVNGSTQSCFRSSLQMAKTVCEEMTELIIAEGIKINVDEKNQVILDKYLDNNAFNETIFKFIEDMMVKGFGATIQYIDNGVICNDFINGDLIIPYAWINNRVTGIATVSQSVIDDKYYNLVTTHYYDKGMYIRENKAFISTSVGQLGEEVEVNSLYEDLIPYEELETEYPRFQFWTLPIANNFDISVPYAPSLFANSVDTLKNIDEKYDSFRNEFNLGRKRIFVSRDAVKAQIDVAENKVVKFFDTGESIYQVLDTSTDTPVKESDMTLRVNEHIQAINFELSLLANKVGLDESFFDFSSKGVKTATEVISENSKAFRTKSKIERQFTRPLEIMVNSILELAGIKNETVEIVWSDSIILDEKTEREEALILLQNGLMSKEKYQRDYMGMSDEEIAQDKEEQANEGKINNIDFSGLDGERVSEDIEEEIEM